MKKALSVVLRARSERDAEAVMPTNAKPSARGSLALDSEPGACNLQVHCCGELGMISMDRHKQSCSAVSQNCSRIYYGEFIVQANIL